VFIVGAKLCIFDKVAAEERLEVVVQPLSALFDVQFVGEEEESAVGFRSFDVVAPFVVE